ncbi:DUF3784 domain-containing protein [Facklamia hominis]|uniref:DUF3784 domain-containing protein n=1 Tax=Facklamia hominis TaxID=178214 RepID=UPI0028894382|nr:DUF3784 domain-containing protein [Facklamia hominis]
MVLLKLILTMLGTTFLLLGYLIVFRKKYSLINGFEAALKAGEKEASDAERVGKTYLLIGLKLLIVMGILCFFV